jgi:uncharacterized protein (TIRG00374 family)
MDRLFMSWKWSILLNINGVNISQQNAFKTYYISSFMGFAIPFGIGPDLIRIFKLKNMKIDSAISAASIIVERILGIVATLIMLLIGLFVFLIIIPKSNLHETILYSIIFLISGLAFSLLFIFNDSISKRVLRFFKLERISQKFKVDKYYDALSVYRKHKITLVYFTFLSVLEQFFPIFATFFAALALKIHLDLITCVAFVPVTVFAERFPLSFFGIGFREGSYIILLSLFHIDYTSAILLSMFIFILEILFLLPAGLWSLFDTRSSLVENVQG